MGNDERVTRLKEKISVDARENGAAKAASKKSIVCSAREAPWG